VIKRLPSMIFSSLLRLVQAITFWFLTRKGYSSKQIANYYARKRLGMDVEDVELPGDRYLCQRCWTAEPYRPGDELNLNAPKAPRV
jgi:hypothetical protein